MSCVNRSSQPVEPFLKWAGGKRWLTHSYEEIFPEKYGVYFEPFLGGGSVYFHLRPKRALLSDLNEELVDTYRAIQCNWQLVWRYLVAHHKGHNKRYYYQVRELKARSAAARAARMIYLNRTCWNGLYRVNLSGVFNVPVGTKNWAISESDDFQAVSSILSNATIKCCDFEGTIDSARAGDFVFADPPYTVKHNYNGFIKYNEKLFSWEDQERLAEALIRAKNRGVHVLLTHACHDSIMHLYKNDFELMKATRHSKIAGDSAARTKIEELIIRTV